MTRPRRTVACALAVAATAALLSACTSPEAMPTPDAPPTSVTSASPSPSPTPVPTAPTLDGDALDNQAFFDKVNRDLIAAGGTLNGRAFINNLEKQGYERGDMEVTPDRTETGQPADNIVFSIRFGTSCLLGQWGNIGYTSMVATVTSTGRCLVGTARPA